MNYGNRDVYESLAGPDQQSRLTADNTARTTALTLDTVARRYYPGVRFAQESREHCAIYDADGRVGRDAVNVDRSSCLTGGVIVGQSQNGLNAFACYAIHDEPVILTGLSCQNTAGGVPVFSSGHNAAAIGGLAAVRNGSVCINASGLHPGQQNQMGLRVGARNSTQVQFCVPPPR
jgi:hypothetical protein